jgi:hypothetical protein
MKYQCPVCKTQNQLKSNPSSTLAPTGGDYEWIETEVIEECEPCRARLAIRLSCWLDGTPISLAAPIKVLSGG